MDKYEFTVAVDGVIDALSRFKSAAKSVEECEEKLAKLEREGYRPKCDYCMGTYYTVVPFTVTSDDGQSRKAPFHFCPVCGRRLTENPVVGQKGEGNLTASIFKAMNKGASE